MSTIGLRQATSADDEFCYQVHRAAMRGSVDAIWGWDEATQRDYHRRRFDPAHTRIITVDGRDVGVLIVDYRPAEVYLERIELHPDYQGHGVGGHLIQHLRDVAAARSQPLILDVLTVNERAYRLYRRLGFQDVGRHGENDIKFRMRAEPHADGVRETRWTRSRLACPPRGSAGSAQDSGDVGIHPGSEVERFDRHE